MRMGNITHRQFLFTEAQEQFLRDKSYRIDRMECFFTLVDLAVTEVTLCPVSKTHAIELLPGQLMVTDVEIARLWGKDRKTVSRLMKKMESLGILTTVKVGEFHVRTLHPYSAWYLDGERIFNEFNTWPQKDGMPDRIRKPLPNRIVTIGPTGTDGLAGGM